MNMLLCVLVVLAALAPSPEIVGTVVDNGGKPISGVSVSALLLPSNLTTKTTVSGADGSFSFSDLPRGFYGLSAKTQSACAFSDATSVDQGLTRVVHLRLVKGLCQNAIARLKP